MGRGSNHNLTHTTKALDLVGRAKTEVTHGHIYIHRCGKREAVRECCDVGAGEEADRRLSGSEGTERRTGRREGRAGRGRHGAKAALSSQNCGASYLPPASGSRAFHGQLAAVLSAPATSLGPTPYVGICILQKQNNDTPEKQRETSHLKSSGLMTTVTFWNTEILKAT